MTAGATLRNARLAAGVTQQELAAAARVHQPAISRIEREGGASFGSVERLLASLGLRLIAVPVGRPTVADLAVELQARVAGASPTIRLLAEVTNNVIGADPEELPLLVATPPAPTGDRRVDAYLAGLVDHACGPLAPRWTSDPRRALDVPWVLNPFPDDRVLDELIRANTPPSFARHGVFVDAADLQSA